MTLRLILFGYRNAFDFIDHSILIWFKVIWIRYSYSVINWISDLLTNRYQRAKLADTCYSQWGPIPSAWCPSRNRIRTSVVYSTGKWSWGNSSRLIEAHRCFDTSDTLLQIFFLICKYFYMQIPSGNQRMLGRLMCLNKGLSTCVGSNA